MLDIQPFRVDVPDSVLDDLNDRLAKTRLPNWIEDIGWEQGIEETTYLRLLDRWRDGFDWREQEERLNAFEHSMADVDGQPIHFVHARSSRPDALPLVLVHGWPGSFHEFLDAIPMLTEPPDGGTRSTSSRRRSRGSPGPHRRASAAGTAGAPPPPSPT